MCFFVIDNNHYTRIFYYNQRILWISFKNEWTKSIFLCILISMFLFMLKKAFFDYWDNFFRMFFINCGYILILASSSLVFFLTGLFSKQANINNIITVIYTIFVFHIYNGAVFGMTREIADYKRPGFKDFFRHLKNSLPVSLLFAFLFPLLIFICGYSIYSYLWINVFFKYFAIFTVISIIAILVTASQYYFPIYFGLDKRFLKIIKKMFLIFFDNPLFSFSLVLLSIIFTVLSIFTAMMIPGLGFITLLLNVGFKLRLYKYDYLEEHPNTPSSKIPWETLLIEDREKVGKRTLKGMIFPWKE